MTVSFMSTGINKFEANQILKFIEQEEPVHVRQTFLKNMMGQLSSPDSDTIQSPELVANCPRPSKFPKQIRVLKRARTESISLLPKLIESDLN
jgi:hypothetical protein